MNKLEQAFIFMTVALHLGLLTKVGTESHDWNRPEFVFAFSACVLIFIQFLFRYLAIIHRYKTETTIQAWVVSLLIVTASLTLIQSTSRFPFWFLVYGFLLFLANFKTRAILARLTDRAYVTVERKMRLQESMILEMSFGIFMIILYILGSVGPRVFPSRDLNSITFFGTLFGLYIALVFTIVMIARIFSNKPQIEDEFEKLNQSPEKQPNSYSH